MSVYYIESSALFKRYHTERGSEFMDELFAGQREAERFITSYLTVVELEATAARALRGTRITPAAYAALLGRLLEDMEQRLLLQPIANDVVDEAVRWTRRHGLRGGDAVHFAAGMLARRATSDLTVYVTSDSELLAAARAEDFPFLNPEDGDALTRLRSYRITS